MEVRLTSLQFPKSFLYYLKVGVTFAFVFLLDLLTPILPCVSFRLIFVFYQELLGQLCRPFGPLALAPVDILFERHGAQGMKFQREWIYHLQLP